MDEEVFVLAELVRQGSMFAAELLAGSAEGSQPRALWGTQEGFGRAGTHC